MTRDERHAGTVVGVREAEFAPIEPKPAPPSALARAWDRLADAAGPVLDNPILVKHARSRLRPSQALPWAAVVLVLSATIAWAGDATWIIGPSAALTGLLGLQVLTLVYGGSNQINASLGGARESGLLDFHRVSPVPPGRIALGFFLGAPVREYALAAVTVPFAAFSAYHLGADPWAGLLWLARLEVALLTTAWFVHALAMLSCLTRKKPKGSIQGSIVAIVLLLIISYFGTLGLYAGGRWLREENPSLNFFGLMVPWLGWMLLYQLPVLGFLGLAATRKMAADRAHALSKAQALGCMAVLTVLTVGGFWRVSRLFSPTAPTLVGPAEVIAFGAVYGLMLAAMVLAVPITPDAGGYTRGVRRALREGRTRPGPWEDAGANRLALLGLCALVLVGATAVVSTVGRPGMVAAVNYQDWHNAPEIAERAAVSDAAWLASRQALLSRPIAVGVLTAAYVGLALQFFSMRTRRSGAVLTVLLLFLAWLVPVLAGATLGMAVPFPTPETQGRTMTVLALSPLPGVVLSAGLGDNPALDRIKLAALAPPITFAFVFNYLLVMSQRKLDRSLRPAKAEAPPD
jgi:hypothetical protein